VTDAGVAEVLLDRGFTLADVPTLRLVIAGCAAMAGLPADRGGEFVLVAHELIANAIEHGGGTGRVQVLRADGALLCQVSDRGPGLSPDVIPAQPPGLAGPDGDEAGCGLLIVSELADRLDIRVNGAGAVVTAALAIAAGAQRHPARR
jgi:anti-sigma regulatory factor (Ser/Thr protein kinase)